MKLLDITEQPVNAMARKRKRQQELEEAAAEKKKAQEQRAAEKQESCPLFLIIIDHLEKFCSMATSRDISVFRPGTRFCAR